MGTIAIGNYHIGKRYIVVEMINTDPTFHSVCIYPKNKIDLEDGFNWLETLYFNVFSITEIGYRTFDKRPTAQYIHNFGKKLDNDEAYASQYLFSDRLKTA